MTLPPSPFAPKPALPVNDFQMSAVYRVMTVETIGKLPEKQARDAVASVKTAKLEAFRVSVRKMETSALFTFMAQHDLLMAEMFGGAPKYSEFESTMVIFAARVAVTSEIDRRIPVPR